MASADLLAENVEKSISHIVQTFNDVINVAKDLLMENLESRYSSQSEGGPNREQTTTGTAPDRFQSTNTGRDEEPLAT